MPKVTISVQAEPHDAASWPALARRLEAHGFDALLVADHPGSGPSPWPSLGAAAAVTTQLRLGTYVLQTGVRDPVTTAADAATLDLLAPGRVLLGLGAGHTFREWEVTGRERPSPADRAGRLAEFVDAVARLLAGGTVSIEGRYLRLIEARLENLRAAGRVALAVGVGGSRQVLRTAARHADVVALSGLGRTLPDGHRHEVRWSPDDLDAQLRVIREEGERRDTRPEIEALVQVVTRTDRREAALAELAERIPSASPEQLAETPFVLIGTMEQMAAQLRDRSERLGISRYVVRESAVDVAQRVLEVLDQRPE